jgi:hypothetical protein
VLLRDAGGQDVRVVAVRHRGERCSLLDAGVFEDLAVEREPDDLPSGEPRLEPLERLRGLVDDGDRMAEALEVRR